jgi:hypothetical protein
MNNTTKGIVCFILGMSISTLSISGEPKHEQPKSPLSPSFYTEQRFSNTARTDSSSEATSRSTSEAKAQGGMGGNAAGGGGGDGGAGGAGGNGSGGSAAVGDVNVDSSVVNETHQRRLPVSSAYAPGLVAGVDTCFGSVSAGAQHAVIGLSFGKTYNDEECQVRHNARLMFAVGDPASGYAMLCGHPKTRQGVEMAGHRCTTNYLSSMRERADRRPEPTATTTPAAVITLKLEHSFSPPAVAQSAPAVSVAPITPVAPVVPITPKVAKPQKHCKPKNDCCYKFQCK